MIDGEPKTETPEECEFFAALARRQRELACPRWQEIERLAGVVRSAGNSSTAIAIALYERGCRLPVSGDEPDGPAAA